MGVLNNIFKWIILERLKEIDKFVADPFATQRSVLNNLIAGGEQTEWGNTHGYTNINGYNDFVKQVSLQDYNSLKPYIEKTMNGEQNVLWPGQMNWFAKSSGTTEDKSKFIPLSKESLMDCHYKAGKDMYALYYSLYPEANLAEGRSLVLGGSHQINKLNDNSWFGDLSAVLMQNLPIWAEVKRVPLLSIALMDNWEEKIEKMAAATIKHKITNVLGVPTWTVILFRKLLEITGKRNISEIWPTLELYVHGGVSFSPYRALFQELVGGENMHYLETYNASEGFFGMQNTVEGGEMLLMLDYGIFYEFMPVDITGEAKQLQPIPLEDVEMHKNYAVIISSNSGLWRYSLGDTVKFTSLHPFKIKVSGRTTHFINAFGEELIVDNAEKALGDACIKTGAIIRDYTAAPVFFTENNNGAHEWLIEFEKKPNDITLFAETLDEGLKRLNSDYEAKRFKDIALGLPIVHSLPTSTFYEWMKRRGKLGGQHKVPRLCNDRRYVDEILEFIK